MLALLRDLHYSSHYYLIENPLPAKVNMKNKSSKTFMILKTLFTFLILSTLTGCTVMANYESAYKMTDAGNIEVKIIPESTVLQTTEKGEYYDKSNNLFIKLFNYIKANQIPMTIPVESGIKDAEMRFYVSADKKDEGLKDTESVKVLKIPERTVVAAGGRGSYSASNIDDAKEKLFSWIKDHPEYEQVGEPYAVYWNSPFRLWFLKHYEVHMPVKISLPKPQL